MNVRSFSKSRTFKGNLKDDNKTSFSIRNKLAENKKTVLKGIESKVKPTKVFLKNNEINIKIDSTNLKLN